MITTDDSQNLIDIAIQTYGNQEAVPVLIADNPNLFAGDRGFELTGSLPDDTEMTIRDEDGVKNKKVLKELDGKVIVSESPS